MTTSSEPTDSAQVDLNKSNTKSYSTTLRIIVFGWIAFIILAFLANSTLAFETGDSAGPNFFVLAFVSATVLVISNTIAIIKGLIEIIKILVSFSQNKVSREYTFNKIATYLILISGILIALK